MYNPVVYNKWYVPYIFRHSYLYCGGVLHCLKFIFFGHLSSYKSSEYSDVAIIQWNVDNLNLFCVKLLIAMNFRENRRIVYMTFL